MRMGSQPTSLPSSFSAEQLQAMAQLGLIKQQASPAIPPQPSSTLTPQQQAALLSVLQSSNAQAQKAAQAANLAQLQAAAAQAQQAQQHRPGMAGMAGMAGMGANPMLMGQYNPALLGNLGSQRPQQHLGHVGSSMPTTTASLAAAAAAVQQQQQQQAQQAQQHQHQQQQQQAVAQAQAQQQEQRPAASMQPGGVGVIGAGANPQQAAAAAAAQKMQQALAAGVGSGHLPPSAMLSLSTLAGGKMGGEGGADAVQTLQVGGGPHLSGNCECLPPSLLPFCPAPALGTLC